MMNCCFVCKDGGELLICDYKDCLKCFHPFCVGKEYSILESDSKWECDRHTCFRCLKSSPYLYCYTCQNSVCRQCLPAVKFCQIKGKYGFCEFCQGLILLIEENKSYDSDGNEVDFTDQETVEFYFAGYYHSIKEKDGFELRDLYAAIERAKIEKKCQSESALEEVEEEEEYHLSDYDGIEDESNCKRLDRENRSNKKENILEGKESEETHSEEAKNGQRASEMNVVELLDKNGKFDDVTRENGEK